MWWYVLQYVAAAHQTATAAGIKYIETQPEPCVIFKPVTMNYIRLGLDLLNKEID